MSYRFAINALTHCALLLSDKFGQENNNKIILDCIGFFFIGSSSEYGGVSYHLKKGLSYFAVFSIWFDVCCQPIIQCKKALCLFLTSWILGPHLYLLNSNFYVQMEMFFFFLSNVDSPNHILSATTTSTRLVCLMWDTVWDFHVHYKEYT